MSSVLLLLVAMISIQTGASFAKGLFPIVGAAGTTAQRLVLASLILCVVYRPWRKIYRPTRSDLRSIAIYGAALGMMNLTFYFALARIPLGITVALEFVGPLSVALFSSRRPVDFVWATLAAIGIVLILPLSKDAVALDPLGIILALVAGGCWALYIIFGQRAGTNLHGGVTTTLGMIAAAIVAAPLGIATAGVKLLDPALLPAALTVAVLSSALPYSLEMRALKKLPKKTFGILMSLEPATAAISGLFFLGEKLTFTQWLAIFCVMIASFGSVIGSRQKTPVTEMPA